MSNEVQIKTVRAEKISFVNRVENRSKLNFENHYAYSVKYGADSDLCRGEFTVKIGDREQGERFALEITLVGIFSFDKSLPKDRIHKQTYRELFPYVRALVTTVTASAGIPPIYLPSVDIDGQDVYAIDLGGHR